MSKRRDRRLRAAEIRDTVVKDTETPGEQHKLVHINASHTEVSSLKGSGSHLGFFGKIESFYWTHYKVLLLIPFILLLLAFAQVGYQTAVTGSFLHKGISLKGGLTVTIPHAEISDTVPLEQLLQRDFPNNELHIRKLSTATGAAEGIIVDADITDKATIATFLARLEDVTNKQRAVFNVEEIGSALGTSFFNQTFSALVAAFVLIGIVVFLYFRTFVPSFAVMLAAFSDMFVTLAVMNILGVKISTAGIAAFLMLIGYSIDTDMLLTINVLKKKEGTLQERVYHSIKTGVTMTFTALGAVGAMLLFSKSEVLTQIAFILFVGLWADLVYTWIQNVGLLRLYLERKKKEH